MSHRGSRLRAPACLVSLAVLLAAGPGAAGEGTTVAPGGVVRWAGPGIHGCEMDGRRFEPVGNACWFPVDLLAAPGTRIEVARLASGRREAAALVVGSYPYPVQRLTVDERHVELGPADAARAEGERRRVEERLASSGPGRVELPLARPLARLPRGGRFGARRIFNGEARSPHAGADYRAAPGTPVRAAAQGTVVLAEEHFFSGRSVYLDHGQGLFSMYFHLQRIEVTAGQRVARGARLGTVGSTGRSTGPHLHFGVRWHGARIDPALLLGPVARVPALAP